MAKQRVLIIDDDPQWCETIAEYLEAHGFEVSSAFSCRQAEEAWRKTRPDVALLDHNLPDGTALTIMPRLKMIDAAIPIVILTGSDSIPLAVESIKQGASQFLTKPVDLATLLIVLNEALEVRRSRQKKLLERELEGRMYPDPFLGKSVVIERLSELGAKVAAFDSPILIQGETGTGKGVLAHWIHLHGPRESEAFVDLNCGGLSRELLETELFGHEKGAFTGATQTKSGLLEVAHKGTVFLDEIADVDTAVQPKLLKVLEEKQFRHLGDTKDRRVDIRLLAATHQDIAELIRIGKFRSDLYFRISAVPLTIPALRERTEDIPILAENLLKRLCSDLAIGKVTLTGGAATALQAYPWPGNIRELRNVLERAVLLRERDQLSENDLHFDAHVEPVPLPSDLTRTLAQMQRDYIAEVLTQHHWRVREAAVKLGIPRSSLYQKIKEYGWNVESAHFSRAAGGPLIPELVQKR
jgi:DNA-binding NtrC family response regulator